MAKVNLILDEAANLRHMRTIDEVLAIYRGYGLRAHLYYQSLAQLKACFPDGQDQTVLANVTQVFFACNDSSAEYISSRIGEQTIVVDSGSTGSGYSSPSGLGAHGQSTSSSNATRNWSQMGRKLLKPEEILAMDERLAITFVAGQKPILTRLERYYEKANVRRQMSWTGTLIISFMLCMIMTNCVLEMLKLLKV
jgi:type IV secretion system protein VirD4